jgi:hypothetical protein
MKMSVGSGFTASLAKPMATSPALQTSRRSRYINSSFYMPELSYLNHSKRGHSMRGRQFDRFFHVRTIDEFAVGDSFIELNDWSIGKRAFAASNADSLGLTDGAKPATGYPPTNALCFFDPSNNFWLQPRRGPKRLIVVYEKQLRGQSPHCASCWTID